MNSSGFLGFGVEGLRVFLAEERELGVNIQTLVLRSWGLSSFESACELRLSGLRALALGLGELGSGFLHFKHNLGGSPATLVSSTS